MQVLSTDDMHYLCNRSKHA